ncbi:hypothetical protein GE09DRAFT_148657 [Coniochaeta sp. 2T2.1]|nr:hypothetical protein GE09DRAFT_148657 [Coniochaeta sp. 2T2.1]
MDDHDSRLLDPNILAWLALSSNWTFDLSVFAVPGLVGGFIPNGATRSGSGRTGRAVGAGLLGAGTGAGAFGVAGRRSVWRPSGEGIVGRVGGTGNSMSLISLAGGGGGTASDFLVAIAVCICSSHTLLSGRARSAYSFAKPSSIVSSLCN